MTIPPQVVLFLFLIAIAQKLPEGTNYVHLALLGAIAAVFFDVQHVPNNYANKTLPMGGPGDPQHYDCHDRTSGLYPAYLATALCVVLTPLYAALDPEYGIKCMRGKGLEEKNAEAEARLRAEAIRDAPAADAVPLEEQAEAEAEIRELVESFGVRTAARLY